MPLVVGCFTEGGSRRSLTAGAVLKVRKVLIERDRRGDVIGSDRGENYNFQMDNKSITTR